MEINNDEYMFSEGLYAHQDKKFYYFNLLVPGVSGEELMIDYPDYVVGCEPDAVFGQVTSYSDDDTYYATFDAMGEEEMSVFVGSEDSGDSEEDLMEDVALLMLWEIIPWVDPNAVDEDALLDGEGIGDGDSDGAEGAGGDGDVSDGDESGGADD